MVPTPALLLKVEPTKAEPLKAEPLKVAMPEVAPRTAATMPAVVAKPASPFATKAAWPFAAKPEPLATEIAMAASHPAQTPFRRRSLPSPARALQVLRDDYEVNARQARSP
jgi:hypothetical protein